MNLPLSMKVKGFELALLYTLQHGLKVHAENSHGLERCHLAVGYVFDVLGTKLVDDVDSSYFFPSSSARLR